ncbi:hypothetical protein CMO93_03070 [Candidatus Woesearchaeota archaeon]|jgi:hypothetical protein|nr:hypothetical protein [Candidatus Woesearchaeota archaeon]|tara:strand:- start:1161 stop:1442 length:282 start_codon:yes stop_codon:yes gene_type:complete
MVKLPKLNKKISSFLTKEDGKISKEKLFKTGVLLSAAALTLPPGVESHGGAHTNQSTVIPHINQISVDYIEPTAVGSHSHSPAHSQHVSHCSY